MSWSPVLSGAPKLIRLIRTLLYSVASLCAVGFFNSPSCSVPTGRIQPSHCGSQRATASLSRVIIFHFLWILWISEGMSHPAGSGARRHVTSRYTNTQEVLSDVRMSDLFSASLLLFVGKKIRPWRLFQFLKRGVVELVLPFSLHHRLHQVQRHESNFLLQEADHSAISLICVPPKVRAFHRNLHMLREHNLYCTGSQRRINIKEALRLFYTCSSVSSSCLVRCLRFWCVWEPVSPTWISWGLHTGPLGNIYIQHKLASLLRFVHCAAPPVDDDPRLQWFHSKPVETSFSVLDLCSDGFFVSLLVVLAEVHWEAGRGFPSPELLTHTHTHTHTHLQQIASQHLLISSGKL